MSSLKDIQTATVTAMKAGDKPRVEVLRMFSSMVQNIAKADGNRDPSNDDVLTAGNRLTKQANETLSFLVDGDERRQPLLFEKSVYAEFMPQKMDRSALTGLIEELLKTAPEGKAAKGHVMKHLNGAHRGMFDAQMANEIVTEKVG